MGRRAYRIRKSPIQVILLVLLWLLLAPLILALLGVLGGAAYLTFSGFSYDTADDIAIIAGAEPLEPEERLLAVDANANTFTLAVNKSDVYWVALKENLLKPLVFDGEDALKNYGFQLDKYALQLTEGHVYVTARLLFHNVLYVPLRAELIPGVQDGKLVFYLQNLYLGQRVMVPLERFSIVTGTEGEPVYTLEKQLHPRMDCLVSARTEGDNLLLTFSFDREEDLFGTYKAGDGAPGWKYCDWDGAKIRYALSLGAEQAGLDEDAALKRCEETPATLMDLKAQLLATGSETSAEPYLGTRDGEIQARFFPNCTRERVDELRGQVAQTGAGRAAAGEAFVKALQEAYLANELKIGPDGVYRDGEPIDPADLLGQAGESPDWPAKDMVTYVLLDRLDEENTPYPPAVEGLPLLSKVLTEKGAAGKIKVNRRVALGVLLRLPNGGTELLYLGEDGQVRREFAPEETVAGEPEAEGTLLHWPEGDPVSVALLKAALTAAGTGDLASLEELVLPEGATVLADPEQAAAFGRMVFRFVEHPKRVNLQAAWEFPRDARETLMAALPGVELLWSGQ